VTIKGLSRVWVDGIQPLTYVLPSHRIVISLVNQCSVSWSKCLPSRGNHRSPFAFLFSLGLNTPDRYEAS
jgi:hypothetical protein